MENAKVILESTASALTMVLVACALGMVGAHFETKELCKQWAEIPIQCKPTPLPFWIGR